MRKFLLRLIRLLGICGWFVICGTVALFAAIGGWAAIKRVSIIAQWWAKGLSRIENINLVINGFDYTKFTHGIIVSNHQGYMDIIVHASIFPLRFAPKHEIKWWPLLGQYLALNRPVWVNRKSKQESKKVLEKFIETLKHGIFLIVYPEGTTTNGRNGILQFKSTPFQAAAEGNFPVLPILTYYPDDTVPWYGDMNLLTHVWNMLGKKQIDVFIYVLPPIYPKGRNRKEMAAFVHNIMEMEYKKILSEHLPGKRPE